MSTVQMPPAYSNRETFPVWAEMLALDDVFAKPLPTKEAADKYKVNTDYIKIIRNGEIYKQIQKEALVEIREQVRGRYYGLLNKAVDVIEHAVSSGSTERIRLDTALEIVHSLNVLPCDEAKNKSLNINVASITPINITTEPDLPEPESEKIEATAE